MTNTTNFTAFSTAVLRTPLLPLASYTTLMQSYSRAALFAFTHSHFVQKALALASPELWSEMEKYLENPSTYSAEKAKALEMTLLKYIARMCARATPFGWFAACTTVSLGKETEIVLTDKEAYSAHTQFDMQFWIAWWQAIAKEPAVQTQLRYFPNTSLYAVGNFYRYIEYRINDKKRREHSISAIRKNAFVTTVLENAKEGKKPYDLASSIIADESEREEALAFIAEMIDSQVLVSQLEATVTGTAEMERALSVFTENKIPIESVEKARAVVEQLARLNRGIQNDTTVSQTIHTMVEDLKIPFDPKYLLQTDLYSKTTKAVVSTKVLQKLKQSIVFLATIQEPRKNYHLEAFRKAFYKRYETKSMPLSVVLDAEIGIGYLQNSGMNDSHPLLDALSIPGTVATDTQEHWTAMDYVLERKLQEALANEATSIALKASDFKKRENTLHPLPATFSAMVEIFKEGQNETVVLESLGSNSAAKLLGRFCSGDTHIHALTQEIVQHEAACFPEAILAEVTHIPESRTGNILRRPVLRPYEIVYLANSVVPKENQITIDDLWVSVVGDTIILKCKRWNKEVIPCLSNAHNYSSNALPIYQFLCDLQGQNSAAVYGFDWGVLKQHYNYFPRVVYKEVVLAKARWHVFADEVKDFRFDAAFALWKEKKKLPQYVSIVSGDNTLLLDLETEICFDILMKTIHSKGKVVLEEFLLVNNSVVLDGAQQQYANQFVFSFKKEV